MGRGPLIEKTAFVLALALGLSGCDGCNDREKPPTGGPALASALASGMNAQPSKSVPPPYKLPPPPMLPQGPMLAMLAGQGVGSIRIGATVATIERHMALPCDFKTETLCRYVTRAVEFELKDGVTERIRVHRHGRSAGKDNSGAPIEYGFFNGAIPPDLRFGMLPKAIQEYLGQPIRAEKVETPNEFNTIERHYYKGMIVEYDLLPNGNPIMGGVVIAKDVK